MKVTRSCDVQHQRVARSISTLSALFLLLLLVTNKSFAAEDNPWILVDVAEGTSLEQALLSLGIPLSSDTADLAGHHTTAIHGRYRARDALDLLLRRSGLSATIDQGFLYVKPAPPQRTRRRRPRPDRRPEGEAPPVEDSMSSVTVTGSHIRENFDLDSGPRPGLISFGQADFKESDFQNLGEALRALPQNFPGGQNPTVVDAGGSQNIVSLSGASSADLRGMGSSSTLTLVNGQRVATAESYGAVDVTGVPILAVKRIGIVTGDVSAIYGADAVAGTVNVVLYDKFEGLQVRVAGGSAINGGGSLQHYSAIGGRSWGELNAYAAVDCAQQDAIDSSQRKYVPITISGTTLLPATRGCSGLLSAQGEFQNNLKASLLGIYTARNSDTTDNLDALSPRTLAATRSSVKQYATIGTVRIPLGADWSGVVTSSVSTDNVHSPAQLLSDGSPPINQSNQLDNRLRSMEVGADGSLPELPNGPWKFAAGGGYNEETFLFDSSPPQPVRISQRRRIRYVFVEGLIPILPWGDSGEDVDAEANSLSLRIAGRTAWYSDLGSTTNPKVTLSYAPARNFSLGVSWGTSYRPPTLVQQYGPSQTTLKFVNDPNSPNGNSSLALFQFGGNPHLRPESSSSVTVDFAFAPLGPSDLVVKLTLYDINDRERIEYPTTDILDPLSDPNVGPYIARPPSGALITQTLAQSPLVNHAGNGYLPSQAVVLINDLNQNISHQRATGADLLVTYGHDTQIGEFKPSANIAYLDLRQQLTPATRDERLSATVFNPPLLRSRLGLTWSTGDYRAALFFNYSGSGWNTETDPPQRIGSWETFDVTLGYTVPKGKYWGNTRFVFSAKNFLNHRPPFVTPNSQRAPAPNFDTTNSSANGTFLMAGVNVEF